MNLYLGHDHSHAVGAQENFIRYVLEDSFEMPWQCLKDLQNADIWHKPACPQPAAKVDDPLFVPETAGVLQLGAIRCMVFPG